MGNRSRYVAVTAAAAAAAVVSARRRAKLRRSMEGVREAIMPTHVTDLPTEARPEGDEAHAPGHRHLGRPAGDGRIGGRRARIRSRYAPGMRQRSPDR